MQDPWNTSCQFPLAAPVNKHQYCNVYMHYQLYWYLCMGACMIHLCMFVVCMLLKDRHVLTNAFLGHLSLCIHHKVSYRN